MTTPSVDRTVRMGFARRVWMPTRAESGSVCRLMVLTGGDGTQRDGVPCRRLASLSGHALDRALDGGAQLRRGAGRRQVENLAERLGV